MCVWPHLGGGGGEVKGKSVSYLESSQALSFFLIGATCKWIRVWIIAPHSKEPTDAQWHWKQISYSIYLANRTVNVGSTYLLTYLLHGAVFLEKLTGLQLVKKFPAFHGTRRFITALTCVRHLSLSWASPIQSIYPHPTSWISILIQWYLG